MKRKANKEKMKICLVGSSGGHLTHAIVTFNTVKSAIEKNKLENSVICIYTMFYRESDYQGLTISLTNNYRLTNKYRCKLIGYDGKILYSSSCGIYKIDMEELETPIM